VEVPDGRGRRVKTAEPRPSGRPIGRADDVAGSGGPAVHLPRALAVLLGTAAAVVVVAAAKASADILAPVLLALVLTIAVQPVSRIARAHGWPSWAATLLAMVAVYGIVLVLVVGITASVVQLAATLPQYVPRANEITDAILDAATKAGLSAEPTASALQQLDLGKVTDVLQSLLSAMLAVLSSAFFLVTLLFFMTAELTSAGNRGAALRAAKPQVAGALAQFVRATQTYLIVSAVFGAIVAVLDTGALWLLGVPLPLMWGLLAFITNFVPNIGFVLGLVPPALLGLLESGWETMVAVILVYCVLNVVIQTFIQPRYVGDAVGLNPTVTFLSLGIWTFVLGPLGALLAVPVTLLVRSILVDADPDARWALAIIGSAREPDPPPPDDAPG
jgi:predicted PurR-regulated permease PerM